MSQPHMKKDPRNAPTVDFQHSRSSVWHGSRPEAIARTAPATFSRPREKGTRKKDAGQLLFQAPLRRDPLGAPRLTFPALSVSL
jgi:hypothetical protein